MARLTELRDLLCAPVACRTRSRLSAHGDSALDVRRQLDDEFRRQQQPQADLGPQQPHQHIDMARAPTVHASVNPEFHGEPTEDVAEFLNAIERIAFSQQWNDEAKCRYFPSFLLDSAAEEWQRLDDAVKTDYDQLTTHFRNKYAPVELQGSYSRELHNAKQLPNCLLYTSDAADD